IVIQAEQIIKIKERLNHILASNTDQDLEKIEKDTDRDFAMTAEEALNYGLIDQVIESK
ncbi:ATP-dependent Clp protease proteolytic subunit, partial [Trichormus variabilis PNB]|uniref:ATP-dependent Clp protease proteolytic subunit n=1 Tax=Anabaena variabilis TaxID=264691 RepID=UPI00162ABDC5